MYTKELIATRGKIAAKSNIKVGTIVQHCRRMIIFSSVFVLITTILALGLIFFVTPRVDRNLDAFLSESSALYQVARTLLPESSVLQVEKNCAYVHLMYCMDDAHYFKLVFSLPPEQFTTAIVDIEEYVDSFETICEEKNIVLDRVYEDTLDEYLWYSFEVFTTEIGSSSVCLGISNTRRQLVYIFLNDDSVTHTVPLHLIDKILSY